MSHLFPQQNYQSQPYGQQSEPLAFFGGPSSASSASPYYPGSRSSLEGNMGAGPSSAGAYASGNMNGGIGGMMSSEGRWWEAFGTGGFEGEPSLMEGRSSCRASSCIAERRLMVRTWNQLFAYTSEIIDGAQSYTQTG
jgi:hypothetical protein